VNKQVCILFNCFQTIANEELYLDEREKETMFNQSRNKEGTVRRVKQRYKEKSKEV
jgi:hypothetical protein